MKSWVLVPEPTSPNCVSKSYRGPNDRRDFSCKDGGPKIWGVVLLRQEKGTSPNHGAGIGTPK